MLIIVRDYICAVQCLKNPYTLGSAYDKFGYYEYSGYKSRFFSQKGKL